MAQLIKERGDIVDNTIRYDMIRFIDSYRHGVSLSFSHTNRLKDVPGGIPKNNLLGVTVARIHVDNDFWQYEMALIYNFCFLPKAYGQWNLLKT